MKKISLVSGLFCTALVFGCGDDGKPAGTGATNATMSGGGSNQTTDDSSGGSTDGGSTTSGGSNSNSNTNNTTSDDPTTAGTTGGPGTTTNPGTSDGTDSCGMFICDPDIPNTGDIACDPWAEDCPSGEKCMPYSGDGDTSWESLKCVPIDPNPGSTGDVCTVEGNGVSGIDTCDLHHMCWNTDAMTGEGTCVKFCNGSPDAPTCDVPMTACTIANMGVLILCLPVCDPVLQDCPGGDLCIQSPMDPNAFICVLDASGEEGQLHDPCEYANACDPGFFCNDPALNSECDAGAAGCCIAFCDLMDPDCSASAGASCLPWYGDGTPPPAYDHVGYCAIPG